MSVPGPRFIKLKRYELVLIAHLHMRIVKIQRVGHSALILPIHVKEGDIQGRINMSSYLLRLIKRGPSDWSVSQGVVYVMLLLTVVIPLHVPCVHNVFSDLPHSMHSAYSG